MNNKGISKNNIRVINIPIETILFRILELKFLFIISYPILKYIYWLICFFLNRNIINLKIKAKMPMKENNQNVGIKKNGSIRVPSAATSDPIILKITKHPIAIKNGIEYNIFFFIVDSPLNLL